MVAHMTLRIEATGARAGIFTLLVDTGFVRGTLGTDDTLWTTCRWSTNKLRQAAANRLTL